MYIIICIYIPLTKCKLKKPLLINYAKYNVVIYNNIYIIIYSSFSLPESLLSFCVWDLHTVRQLLNEVE